MGKEDKARRLEDDEVEVILDRVEGIVDEHRKKVMDELTEVQKKLMSSKNDQTKIATFVTNLTNTAIDHEKKLNDLTTAVATNKKESDEHFEKLDNEQRISTVQENNINTAARKRVAMLLQLKGNADPDAEIFYCGISPLLWADAKLYAGYASKGGTCRGDYDRVMKFIEAWPVPQKYKGHDVSGIEELKRLLLIYNGRVRSACRNQYKKPVYKDIIDARGYMKILNRKPR